MILGYETIMSKITSFTGLERSAVEQKINQKIVDYQDLISKDGAAHMVANDLSVKLFDSSPKVFKVKDVSRKIINIKIEEIAS